MPKSFVPPLSRYFTKPRQRLSGKQAYPKVKVRLTTKTPPDYRYFGLSYVHQVEHVIRYVLRYAPNCNYYVFKSFLSYLGVGVEVATLKSYVPLVLDVPNAGRYYTLDFLLATDIVFSMRHDAGQSYNFLISCLFTSLHDRPIA